MKSNTKILVGAGVAVLAAGGVYWFVKGRKESGTGPLITNGTVKTLAGHRYRAIYLHSTEAGKPLRDTITLMATADPTISIEKPSDEKTIVEITTTSGQEVSMVVPSESLGIQLVSVQEVPVNKISGFLSGI